MKRIHHHLLLPTKFDLTNDNGSASNFFLALSLVLDLPLRRGAIEKKEEEETQELIPSH